MTILALKKARVTPYAPVQAPTRFYPQLDGLRALSVLLVLLCHMDDLDTPHILGRLFLRGWIGVDVFFVLSGFLITKILLNCQASVRGFLFFVLRRILRTWPLYFALLALAFVVFRRIESGAHIRWILQIFFLQNYTQGTARTLSPTWSLCVEEHFYFAWPLLVFLLPRRVLFPTLSATFVLLPFLRLWGWHHGLWWQIYTETQFHLDGLVAGACVALLLPWHMLRPRLCRWVAISIFLLGALGSVAGLWRDGTVYGMVHRGDNIVFGFTFLAIMFAGLLWILLHGEAPLVVKLFSMRPLRYIGRISYGVYLLHFAVIETLNRLPLKHFLGGWADSWAFLIPLRIGAVIFVAGISYRFFESPILRWKEQFK